MYTHAHVEDGICYPVNESKKFCALSICHTIDYI